MLKRYQLSAAPIGGDFSKPRHFFGPGKRPARHKIINRSMAMAVAYLLVTSRILPRCDDDSIISCA